MTQNPFVVAVRARHYAPWVKSGADDAAVVAETLVSIAQTMVTDFDISEMTDRLVTASLELLSADAAGLIVHDQRGGVAVLGSAFEALGGEEQSGLLADDGPLRECMRTGELVVCADLEAEPLRWPAFGALARAAGMRSVLAVPLRLRRESIGALCVLVEAARGYDGRERQVLSALADMATIALLQHREVERTSETAAQLQQVLDERVVISQAAGVLVSRDGVSATEALALLLDRSRDTGRRMIDVGRQILGDLPAH